jgi:hypothetical protein
MVCAGDDNLKLTNLKEMLQEVFVSYKAYNAEMKPRKLSRLG